MALPSQSEKAHLSRILKIQSFQELTGEISLTGVKEFPDEKVNFRKHRYYESGSHDRIVKLLKLAYNETPEVEAHSTGGTERDWTLLPDLIVNSPLFDAPATIEVKTAFGDSVKAFGQCRAYYSDGSYPYLLLPSGLVYENEEKYDTLFDASDNCRPGLLECEESEVKFISHPVY